MSDKSANVSDRTRAKTDTASTSKDVRITALEATITTLQDIIQLLREDLAGMNRKREEDMHAVTNQIKTTEQVMQARLEEVEERTQASTAILRQEIQNMQPHNTMTNALRCNVDAVNEEYQTSKTQLPRCQPRMSLITPAQANLKYDGSTDVDIFLDKFELIASLSEWTKEQQGTNLMLSLEGVASEVLASIDKSNRTSFVDLVARLRSRFGLDCNRAKILLRSRVQKKGSH